MERSFPSISDQLERDHLHQRTGVGFLKSSNAAKPATNSSASTCMWLSGRGGRPCGGQLITQDVH